MLGFFSSGGAENYSRVIPIGLDGTKPWKVRGGTFQGFAIPLCGREPRRYRSPDARVHCGAAGWKPGAVGREKAMPRIVRTTKVVRVPVKVTRTVTIRVKPR